MQGGMTLYDTHRVFKENNTSRGGLLLVLLMDHLHFVSDQVCVMSGRETSQSLMPQIHRVLFFNVRPSSRMQLHGMGLARAFFKLSRNSARTSPSVSSTTGERPYWIVFTTTTSATSVVLTICWDQHSRFPSPN